MSQTYLIFSLIKEKNYYFLIYNNVPAIFSFKILRNYKNFLLFHDKISLILEKSTRQIFLTASSSSIKFFYIIHPI